MQAEIKSNTEFSHEDSLKTIESMIHLAKGKVNNNSFYFILWGWVIFTGSLLTFILLKINYPNPNMAWSVVIIGVVGSMFKGIKQGKTSNISSHLDKIYNGIWLVFGLNYIFIFLWAILTENFALINPFVTLIAGTCTILSGFTIRFKPLIIGGLLLWLAGAIGFFIGEYQLLATAIGILLGYLIPGYLLKRKA